MNEDNTPQWDENAILSQSMNCVPKDLFRTKPRKEVIVDKRLSKDLQLRTGQQTLKHFSECLVKLQQTEPSFAMAAAADAILSLEALIKSHTNADEETLEIVCGTFGVAIFNAATTHSASIVECNEDERIYDFTPLSHEDLNND